MRQLGILVRVVFAMIAAIPGLVIAVNIYYQMSKGYCATVPVNGQQVLVDPNCQSLTSPLRQPAINLTPTSGPAPTLRKVITNFSYPCFVGQIKGNRNSHFYHLPNMYWYSRLTTDVECFDTDTGAENAGYTLSNVKTYADSFKS